MDDYIHPAHAGCGCGGCLVLLVLIIVIVWGLMAVGADAIVTHG